MNTPHSEIQVRGRRGKRDWFGTVDCLPICVGVIVAQLGRGGGLIEDTSL